MPVQTLDGTVEITLATRRQSGTYAQIEREGTAGRGMGAGDLLVTPRIVLPEKIDADLEAQAKRLSENGPVRSSRRQGSEGAPKLTRQNLPSVPGTDSIRDRGRQGAVARSRN